MKIDLVLPLKVRGSYDCDDLQRTAILLRSIRAFMDPSLLGTLWIVANEAEIAQISAAMKPWADLPISIIAEQELVPEFTAYPSLRGWRKQQIIKLAASYVVTQPYYLTLDADVICLRPISSRDLFVDGRALIQYEPRSLHPKWWRSSARLLELPVDTPNDGQGMSVTPALLAKELVALLQADLTTDSESWIQRLCNLHRPWHISNWTLSRLRRAKWTEYSLYYLTALKHGCLDNYHVQCATDAVPQYLLNHDAHPFESWDTGATFSDRCRGLFCVVGSKSMLPPSTVWDRVAPFIPEDKGDMS